MTSRIPKMNFNQPEIKKVETTKNNLSKITWPSGTPANNNRLPKIPAQPTRKFLSRRSKSTTELRPIARNAQIAKTEDIFRKPLVPVNSAPIKTVKRRVPTQSHTDATKAKVAKINMKPAPYDYKARFNLLLQEHNALKARLVELEESNSDKHQTLTDKVYSLEREIIEKDSVIQSNESIINRYKAENTTLSDKVLSLTNKVQNFEQEIVEKDSIIQSNASCISNYKTENASLGNELKTVTEKYKGIEEKHSQLVLKTELLEESLEVSVAEAESLRRRLIDADKERQIMHNTILDLKGNIRVFCRVRPPTESEASKSLCLLQYPDETGLVLSKTSIENTNNKRNARQIFNFDRVFSQDSSQADVFRELALLVQSALDGYNICIFAYGQTGSGKTYTMEGGSTEDSLGMIPRTIDCVFSSIEARKTLGWEFRVTASFLQIYNEHIYDLLDGAKNQRPHDILMTDSSGTDVYVSDLSVREIKTGGDLKRLMLTAQQNRAVAATEMNERSSRSHSVSKITLTAFNKNDRKRYVGCINLVDLAGSERPRNSETARLAETKNINRSLANLTNVIMALLDNCDHVPYRNSKLTHLLMPSLGGNSKTLMMVNVSPFEECYNESVNSLRFATQVNECKTAAKKRNFVKK